jgi:hypothetical protein
MSELIERACGKGHVLSGDVLVTEVVYDVEVWQDYIGSGHLKGHGTAPSTRTVKCTLSALSIPLPLRDTLTLVMSDKRKLNFYNSGDDNVTVMGAIYD